ncbi:nucleoside triphosphate pyrophosphohydrolase [Clostridiaceae bacterium HSG29]|nr:nucleoside triphosphate pyrophosphohydrolase [Clostridiaceae bacterium HSG29]
MIKEKVYNKLVRDKIPEIIEKAGHEYYIHTADKNEYINKLIYKVSEELKEFEENPCEEEMADILEVLESLTEIFNLSDDKIKNIKEEKKIKRGGFTKKIILEKVIEK